MPTIPNSSFARRAFLRVLGALGLASAAPAVTSCSADVGADDGEVSIENLGANEYHYIVVGSGAGGGPLAANLARAGYRVLLLEAGSDQGDNPNYQVPAFHGKSTEDPSMRWDYVVRHYSDDSRSALDEKLTRDPQGRKGILYPRAGTLGGCTAHNAMITVLPHASDWDDLARLTGDTSWASSNMRRYYEEPLERCAYMPEGTPGHGTRGWLQTERPDATLALTDLKVVAVLLGAVKAFSSESNIFAELVSNVGLLRGILEADVNSNDAGRDKAQAIFSIPLATRGGKRTGTREYIKQTAAALPRQLVVATNALATRVLTSAGSSGKLRATGVEYMTGEHLYRADPGSGRATSTGTVTATAVYEVIVSAGAFNTPQLLKLSGIGPKEELTPLGIPVKLDLPGVGQNLQDRYEVGIVSELSPRFLSLDRSPEFSILGGCTFNEGRDPCLDRWRLGEGPYTSNGAVCGIVKRSAAAKTPDPDLFVFGVVGSFKGYYPGYAEAATHDAAGRIDRKHFTWAVLKAHTQNRAGFVKLRSKDPRDVPEINFRYFDEGTAGAADADLDAVAEGVELVRAIEQSTEDVLHFTALREVYPGTDKVRDRATTRQWVRDNAWGHHASCTCPIGAATDRMAVLDGDFRVRGTENLRVVDASVFPKIPGFFIVSAIYMVSEKATDVILAARGKRRVA